MHGGWGNITTNTLCSRTCGSGTQTLSKMCNNPKPQNGGSDCQCNEKEICDGKTSKIEIECNMGPCPGNVFIFSLDQYDTSS